MNPHTPLTEVAHHLPKNAAGRLSDCPNAVQISVLTAIRETVIYLETIEVTLDPIEYSEVLGAVTLALIPAHIAIYQLSQKVGAR